jgi:hypothetical protein
VRFMSIFLPMPGLSGLFFNVQSTVGLQFRKLSSPSRAD